jgi:Eco57I restriction-modification methylase/TaqI-like C-terminal specificity domain
MPSDLALTQRILDLLKELSFASLKHLFWTELNYHRAAQALSMRAWPGEEQELLSQAPVLLATAGASDGFHVLYCRMAADRLSLADERKLVTLLLREHPYALFVFSNEPQDAWHFVNVKIAVPHAAEENGDPGRRRVFRRIAVEPGEPNRTGAERLAELDAARFPGGDGASPLAVQEIHDHAFDVEKVTAAFYDEYVKIFGEVERRISGFSDDAGKRRFTQRLFNRLLFVAFVQKKGWLKFQGRTDYLQALWADYRTHASAEPGEETNFYRDRLQLLFHAVFNGQRDYRPAAPHGHVQMHVGTGPYLNGGLFDEKPLDRTPGLLVPDAAVELVLKELLWRFNFTITEASPLEVEVAVDPEMLGKVFEELVTGRHESGSYYTPKGIVSFMCREALKGYLRTAVPQETPDAVAAFVDRHVAAALGNGEAVLRALRDVKACDPACGSGAYLLGMLHELLDLREALFATGRLDPVSAYARKLEIIQNNVYGVDVDDFAIETARLRLWLSLVVDFEGDGDDESVPPLPNLDFKIERGDSLAAPIARQYDLADALVEEYRAAKAAFMRETGWRKHAAFEQVERCRDAIAAWIRGGGQVEGFDWVVEFAEVFALRAGQAPGRGGGFDIVVANPPYVRMELLKERKPALKRTFPQVHAERADLYVYFFARALELLAPGGMLVFISPNKWLKASYGRRLRGLLAKTTTLWSITDFGDLPVFPSASAYPLILVAQPRPAPVEPGPVYTRVESLGIPYPDIRAVIDRCGVRLPTSAVSGEEWRLAGAGEGAAWARRPVSGTALGRYVAGRMIYGVKSGLSAAFTVNARERGEILRRSPAAERVLKPTATGKEVRRWRTGFSGKWMIYLPHGVDVNGLEAVLDHLAPYRGRLEARATSQHWYELQQPQARYVEAYARPKIIYQRFQVKPCFSYDTIGLTINDSLYAIDVQDLYLLGVLNSGAFWGEIGRNCTQIQNGYQLLRNQLEKTLVPDAGARDREAVAELAHRCVEAGGTGAAVSEWEAEIDDRVATLYGLPARERAA